MPPKKRRQFEWGWVIKLLRDGANEWERRYPDCEPFKDRAVAVDKLLADKEGMIQAWLPIIGADAIQSWQWTLHKVQKVPGPVFPTWECEYCQGAFKSFQLQKRCDRCGKIMHIGCYLHHLA